MRTENLSLEAINHAFDTEITALTHFKNGQFYQLQKNYHLIMDYPLTTVRSSIIHETCLYYAIKLLTIATKLRDCTDMNDFPNELSDYNPNERLENHQLTQIYCKLCELAEQKQALLQNDYSSTLSL